MFFIVTLLQYHGMTLIHKGEGQSVEMFNPFISFYLLLPSIIFFVTLAMKWHWHPLPTKLRVWIPHFLNLPRTLLTITPNSIFAIPKTIESLVGLGLDIGRFWGNRFLQKHWSTQFTCSNLMKSYPSQIVLLCTNHSTHVKGCCALLC